MSERTVSVRLQLLTAGYIGPMPRALAATRRFTSAATKEFDQLNKEIDKAATGNKLRDVASNFTGAGLAVGAAVGVVVAAAARFDKAMSEVRAVTNATAESYEALGAAAIEAGKSTRYSATEAANAEAELARAGLSVTDILNGGLKGALALAAAGQLDLEEAAIVTAKAINTFGLEGRDATHVADVLAASANKSATNVHEMGFATKQAGLIASQMGVSFEETAGTLALFAQNGLAGSDGGTSLKTALMFLANPTKKASSLMKELGIDVWDAQGNFIGMAGTADQLDKALSPLTDQERAHALAVIFGSDAMRAGNVLFKEGRKGVDEFTTAVDDNGAAARTAAIMTDNLAGDYERLTSAAETFAIEAGGPGNEALRGLAQGATALLDVLVGINPAITGTIVIVAGLAAGGLILIGVMIKAKAEIAKVNAQLRATGPAGAKAADGLRKVGKAAGYAVGALALLATATEVLNQLTAKAPINTERVASGLADLADHSKAGGDAARLWGDDLSYLSDQFYNTTGWFPKFGRMYEDLVPGMRAMSEFGLGWSFNDSKEQIEALDEALTSLVAKGTPLDDLRKIRLKILQQSGLSNVELAEQLPGFTFAMTEAEKAANGVVVAETKVTKQTGLLAGGLTAAVTAGKSLTQVFDELNGDNISVEKSMSAAEQALDDLTEAYKGKNNSQKLDEAEGRKHSAANIAVAESARDVAQAVYTQTGSLGDAKKAYDGYISRLKESLKKEGLKPAAIQAIIDKFAQMPTLVAPEVKIKGLEWAIERMRTLKNLLGSNVAGANVNAGTNGVGGRRWGGVVDHAMVSGGVIAGAGALRAQYVTAPTIVMGERATGGELYMPRNGDPRRNEQLLTIGAGWAGGTFVPGGGKGGGGTQITNNLTVQPLTANLSVGQLEGLMRQMDARSRVNRPG
jgi:TP901 family phage tail tape measure protein